MANGQSDQLNLTVVALVALVAIVGLVALVMNATTMADSPLATGSRMAAADDMPAELDSNIVGDLKRKRIIIRD